MATILHSVINVYRQDSAAVDRLAAGGGIPDWARARAVESSRKVVPNPEDLVECVLAGMTRADQAAQPDQPHG